MILRYFGLHLETGYYFHVAGLFNLSSTNAPETRKMRYLFEGNLNSRPLEPYYSVTLIFAKMLPFEDNWAPFGASDQMSIADIAFY